MTVEELIESIDVDQNLDADKKAELAESVNRSLKEKIDESYRKGLKKGKEDVLTETVTQIKEAKEKAFKDGVEQTLTEMEQSIKEAEKLAHDSGIKTALDAAEGEASSYDKEVKAALLEFSEVLDRYLELTVQKSELDTTEKVTDQMTEALNDFLEEKVQDLIPESLIIDYDRAQRLEKVFNTFKNALVLEESDVQNKIKELNESALRDVERAKTTLIAESERRIAAEQKLAKTNATLLLVEKLEGLPSYERGILKKKFAGASYELINESFDKAYDNLKGNLDAKAEKNKVVISEALAMEAITEDEEQFVTKTQKTNTKQVIKESTVEPKANIDPAMARYVDVIERSTGRK